MAHVEYRLLIKETMSDQPSTRHFKRILTVIFFSTMKHSHKVLKFNFAGIINNLTKFRELNCVFNS